MATARFATGSNITFKEVTKDGMSPKIYGEIDRSYAQRTIDVAWDDAVNFHIGVLGFPRLGATNKEGKPFVSRMTPWPFPLFRNPPGGTFTERRDMFVSKSIFEGYGVPDDKICYSGDPSGNTDDFCARYKTARFTLHYDTPTYTVLSDNDFKTATQATPSLSQDESTWKRYVTKVIRPQGEPFIIDQGSVAFFYGGISPAIPIVAKMSKIILSYNFSVTWHQIPEDCVPCRLFNQTATDAQLDSYSSLAADMPNPAIDSCLGCVNDRTFNGSRQGTLLLMAAEIKPIKSPLNARIYDITYMFKYFNPDSAGANALKLRGPGGVIRVTNGNNHVYLWAHNIPKAQQATVMPGWYEAINSRTLASSEPFTNFGAKTDGVNISNFANFANLFRPATYPI